MVNRLFTKDDSLTPKESATETHRIRKTFLKKKLIAIPISSRCDILRLFYIQYGHTQQTVIFLSLADFILGFPVPVFSKLVT